MTCWDMIQLLLFGSMVVWGVMRLVATLADRKVPTFVGRLICWGMLGVLVGAAVGISFVLVLDRMAP